MSDYLDLLTPQNSQLIRSIIVSNRRWLSACNRSTARR